MLNSRHERDSQVAFVSETGVPAHERDPQAAFVSETGVPAHERDQQAAFVSKLTVVLYRMLTLRVYCSL